MDPTDSNGFRSCDIRAGKTYARELAGVPASIVTAANRLRGVTIENLDFRKLIPKFDSAETFFYVDPPYLAGTRSAGGKGYVHEMTTECHRQLAWLLNKARGKVAISGYQSDLYSTLYGGWRRAKKRYDGERSTRIRSAGRGALDELRESGGRGMSAQRLDASLVRDLLGVIHRQFYPDAEKELYQDRNFLLRAVTFPAKWLKQRGVALPEKEYRALLLTIFTTIKHHGATGQIRRFSAYFLHCVQEHMKHHGEEYYDRGKQIRGIIADVHLGVRKAKPTDPQLDDSTELLAAIHATIKSRGGRKKKAVAP